MKEKETLYWFCPNGHWNVLKSKEVYDTLSRFFGPEYLRITIDEERQS